MTVFRQGQEISTGADSQRSLGPRSEIPLFIPVILFEQFKSEVKEYVADARVRERAAQLDRFFSFKSSELEHRVGSPITDERTRQAHVKAFHDAILEGLERTDSPISPENLRDAHGLRLDSSRNLKFDDVKQALLRETIFNALDRLFNSPSSSVEADKLVVDKIFSLTGMTHFNYRMPMHMAVVGAFADLITSPGFREPMELTPEQEKFMTRLFVSTPREPSIIENFIDLANNATQASRSYYIHGETSDKMPQEMERNKHKIVAAEKHALSAIESLFRIQQTLMPGSQNSGVVDISRLAFGDTKPSWAASYLSPELARSIQQFFDRDFTEDTLHRTHNVGMDSLKFVTNVVPRAFEREGMTPTIWPSDADLERLDRGSFWSPRKPR